MADPPTTSRPFPEEILSFYAQGKEQRRLSTGIGPLELVRMQELIQRYLPPPPVVVFDIGGGPGDYSCWLARLGYETHLIDIVPLHVEQARAASLAQPEHPIATLEIGDARELAWPDACADGVLLHGPLYHLTEREDRLAALREAGRILRPGGVLLAVGITAYSSTLVGFVRGWIADPEYRRMCQRELADGQHRQPPTWPGLFTTAYFHRPGELEAEMGAAGVQHQETLAVQGPGWLLDDFGTHWQDEGLRQGLLEAIRRMERDSIALGISPFLLAVGHKT